MKHIQVPVKEWDGAKWGDLNSMGLTHEIVGEVVKLKEDSYSFSGGHRVRLYKFKKNVAFKLQVGIDLDIASVTPSTAPPRKQGR